MTREEIERRRAEIVERHGPWTANNIHLGHGVYTMGAGLTGVSDARVERILQVLTDFAPKPLEDMRVLDLGAYEGEYAVALGRRGAAVVSVEAREAHVAKARFAVEALGLERVRIEHADVRELSSLELGTFDCVLCLGLLYHLEAERAAALVREVFHHCSGLAVFETQIGLSGRARVTIEGREYRGFVYPEDVAQPGASVVNPESFWFTRASLLNLLSDTGFTSVLECLSPAIPELDAYRDHVVLVAGRGEPVADHAARHPERHPLVAHPTQGRRYRVLERVRSLRGGGESVIFRKSRS